MGLFKKIVSGVKNVFKGVGKVFKKVVGFVGKIAASKWGKILMLAAAVFTAGMALYAGVTSFASTSGGFLTKFVAGAKEFTAALAHPMSAAKKSFGGAASAAGQAGATAATPGATIAGAATEGLPAAAGAVEVGSGAGALAGAEAAGTATQGGLLSKAAGAAKALGKGTMDFAASPGGGLVLSKGLEGYSQGKMAEAQLAEQQRMSGPFSQQAYQDILMRAHDLGTPQGFLDRARQLDRSLTRPMYPVAPGAPEDVYGSYVIGG